MATAQAAIPEALTPMATLRLRRYPREFRRSNLCVFPPGACHLRGPFREMTPTKIRSIAVLPSNAAAGVAATTRAVASIRPDVHLDVPDVRGFLPRLPEASSPRSFPRPAPPRRFGPNSPKQHIAQSTVVSIIGESNALTQNLNAATRAPAASTTVLWKLR